MITRDMTIAEILVRYPQTLAVFRQFGLSCQECQIADFEEVGHGAGVHNIDVEELLRELNKAVGL
jgi:hybrid cluster-associated redox disulfide protein